MQETGEDVTRQAPNRARPNRGVDAFRQSAADPDKTRQGGIVTLTGSVGRRCASLLAGPQTMKIYLMSLGAGLLVGIIYSLIQVRSPAPPVVALVGLLGILVGEQLPPLLKGLWSREPTAQSWHRQVKPHVFGHLPAGDRRPGPSGERERT
ncbi:XapX domain-containing protein [Bosea sp. OAE506]